MELNCKHWNHPRIPLGTVEGKGNEKKEREMNFEGKERKGRDGIELQTLELSPYTTRYSRREGK